MRRVWTSLVLMGALVALTAGSALGQGEPQELREPIAAPAVALAVEPVAAPAEAPAADLAQRNIKQYLPMLRPDPIYQVLFGSSASATGEVTAPATVFPTGALRLYIDARFTGIVGARYRTDIIFPSGTRLKGSNVTATQPTQYDRYFICRTIALRCGSGEVPLLAGTYTVEAFVNDALVRTGQAIIR